MLTLCPPFTYSHAASSEHTLIRSHSEYDWMLALGWMPSSWGNSSCKSDKINALVHSANTAIWYLAIQLACPCNAIDTFTYSTCGCLHLVLRAAQLKGSGPT